MLVTIGWRCLMRTTNEGTVRKNSDDLAAQFSVPKEGGDGREERSAWHHGQANLSPINGRMLVSWESAYLLLGRLQQEHQLVQRISSFDTYPSHAAFSDIYNTHTTFPSFNAIMCPPSKKKINVQTSTNIYREGLIESTLLSRDFVPRKASNLWCGSNLGSHL